MLYIQPKLEKALDEFSVRTKESPELKNTYSLNCDLKKKIINCDFLS